MATVEEAAAAVVFYTAFSAGQKGYVNMQQLGRNRDA